MIEYATRPGDCLEIKARPYKKDFPYSYTCGVFPTIELMDHCPSAVFRIIVSSRIAKGYDLLKERAARLNVPLVTDDKTIERLSPKENCFAIGLFVKYACTLDPARHHIVLVNPSDMGNLGTIIRTADWFGIKKIVISEDTCDPWQPKVIQSTMGSIFRTQISETNIVDFLKEVKTPVFGALMQGKNLYQTQIKDNQGVIIIGSESHGIRENVMPYVNCPITIPKAEGSETESLNASMAAGIIMAEVFRRNL